MSMNKLRILIVGIIFLSAGLLSAQNNKVLLSIAEEDVTVDEFMYVYNKNNTLGDQKTDRKSIDEYLDLYINFKLKVKEAEELGLDTVTAFIEELAGYREQLAEPYFVNEEIIEELLVEAYDRKKTDLRASHVLVRVGPAAMPEDTLVAYKKIMEAKKRVTSGEDFAKVAKMFSDDPSARDRVSPRNNKNIRGNGGDLGYFTVFDMVYPFETGAYNTEVGNVSDPVRSDFGYHIIKITNRIPAQGSMEVAHLFIQMPENAAQQDSTYVAQKADSLYQRIMDGEDFDKLVTEYSDDKGSAARGGMLPKFNVNRMVPEFIQVISTMTDSGEVAKPVLTSYGWHIIKLYSKSGIKSFEEEEPEMSKRLKKDKRAQKSRDIIISEIKNEYNYTVNEEGLNGMYALIDSTIYEGKWAVPENITLNLIVFSLGDRTYSQQEFATFLQDNQNIGKDEKINEFINKKFKEFSDQECKAYEDSKLEEKHPEFKAIVKEYRDGILLFELTNEKIWTFATKDTVGLENYYDLHKNEFMWDTRLDASTYSFYDTTHIDSVRALVAQGLSDDDIDSLINTDLVDRVQIERKKFPKNNNDLIDSIKWKKGVTDIKSYKGKSVFVVVHGKVAPEPKTFDESRGLITAGYQEYLELEWIKELRDKYSFFVYEEVLSEIIK